MVLKFRVLLSVVVGTCSVWYHRVSGCIHDQIRHDIKSNSQAYPDNHPFVVAEQRRRRLDSNEMILGQPTGSQAYDRIVGQAVDEAVYQPIRIVPYYDNSTLNALPKEKRDMIFKIVPDAIARFKLLLSVVPVQGNLMAQRSCGVIWVTTPVVCQTIVEAETCLEMPIPSAHFGKATTCSTCPTKGCIGGDCTSTTGTGVPNADFVLYVRAVKSNFCSDSVLAYASSCQKDQYDRPTFGMANFCPDQIKAEPRDYENQLSTAMHEITHALGFSSQFYAYMRNPDGTPRTPRDANGDPPIEKGAKCANGKSSGYYIRPGSTTVKTYSERDTSVARMVTPQVSAFVKTHFGCSDLEGAEIENQDDGCLGSHWEERIFEPEYMTPVSSYRNVISGLTLAFFEDSGWYKTNASMIQRLHFGANRGCSFAKDKCINPDTGNPVASDHYCTNVAVESCSVDATSRSVCALTSGKSIPSAFQYFRKDATMGGTNDFADFCPLNSAYTFGDCTNPSNLVFPTAHH
ncbi:hypothetical protein PINS_up015990 [Pythium insidiosum]|nr:hypothetical protein PINS_up015990 [Pythium insidiosum]